MVKPLSYYIQSYLRIESRARAHEISLMDAKAELEGLDADYMRENSRSPDRLVLADLTEPNQVALWTDSDGSRVRVADMTSAHLHYALAKAERGEYPDSICRQLGIRALKIEAFRRLRNELVK
jgi:hypothetical protein